MATAAGPGAPLRQLDGLRGIGAMSFLLYHFQESLPANGVAVPPLVLYLCTNLTVLMLHMFFAVSAFILFGSLERIRAEQGGAPRGSRRHVMAAFYTRRFFRIVPLWWLVLTVELFRRHLGADVYLANATFAFGLLSFDPRFLPIGVSWTLFVEESFYAVVPAVHRWIRGVGSSLLFFALMLGVSRAWTHAAPALGVPATNDFVRDFPLSYFRCFAVGLVVRSLQPRLTARWTPWLDGAALVAVALAAFALPLATPAVFLLLLATLAPGSRLGRWLAAAPLVFIGVRCYFIYITHDQLFVEPAVEHVMPWLARLAPVPFATPIAVTVAFLLAVGACLAVSAASMKWFEAPLLRIGKRLSSRVLRAGTPTAPAPRLAA